MALRACSVEERPANETFVEGVDGGVAPELEARTDSRHVADEAGATLRSDPKLMPAGSVNGAARRLPPGEVPGQRKP